MLADYDNDVLWVVQEFLGFTAPPSCDMCELPTPSIVLVSDNDHRGLALCSNHYMNAKFRVRQCEVAKRLGVEPPEPPGMIYLGIPETL
jgi:hypothetical protein